jgi:hypothetical protein
VPSPTLLWIVPHFSYRYKLSPLQAHWGRWCHTRLLQLACLFTVHVRECPFPLLWSSGLPTLFVTCLFFFSCLFIIQFFFLFSLGRGQPVQEAMLICPRECCVMLICSPGGIPRRVGAGSGGAGTLLVSPFNMAGGCYAWAGGMEVLEFCLFLVVFPPRCISSVSPRVYFRKHALCFLPLAAILKSLLYPLYSLG